MFRNITPVVQNLLLINILVFVVANFVFPVLNEWFALYFIQSAYFKPFQFLTYMFMHADFWHLFSNMFGLLIFGPLLEQFLGPKKLFILWMVCGIGAGVLYSGYSMYEYKSLEDKVLTFERNPDPDYFNKLVLENRGYFSPEVFDFVGDFSKNPGDPMYIERAEKKHFRPFCASDPINPWSVHPGRYSESWSLLRCYFPTPNCFCFSLLCRSKQNIWWESMPFTRFITYS